MDFTIFLVAAGLALLGGLLAAFLIRGQQNQAPGPPPGPQTPGTGQLTGRGPIVNYWGGQPPTPEPAPTGDSYVFYGAGGGPEGRPRPRREAAPAPVAELPLCEECGRRRVSDPRHRVCRVCWEGPRQPEPVPAARPRRPAAPRRPATPGGENEIDRLIEGEGGGQ